jgi:DNA modification methylase
MLQVNAVHEGDCLALLRQLPADSVDCVVTSPPYWGLRDYGVSGQLGLERTPEEYVTRLTVVFAEVRRILRPTGTLWLNLGDCYATGAGKVGVCPGGGAQGERWKGPATQPNRLPLVGLQPKNLVGIPWRVAFALQADGWYLRSDIVWAKPNAVPESIKDRPTRAHEHVFLLAKSRHYFYDGDAVREPAVSTHGSGSCYRRPERIKFRDKRGARGSMTPWQPTPYRRRRSVWTIQTRPFRGAHFATFPPALVEPCILAGCPAGGLVLDPFGGSGTVGEVAARLGRQWMLFDLNPEYAQMARSRIASATAAKPPKCEPNAARSPVADASNSAPGPSAER